MIDGIVRIKPLMNALKAQQIPSVAITDIGNLFSVVKHYKAALSMGIKPIIGAEILIENKKAPLQPFHLVFLCQNNIGYHALTCLISKAYLEGDRINSIPIVKKNWLAEHSEGLIVLSSARQSEVAYHLKRGETQLAVEALKFFKQLYPDRFYLEILRTQREQEEEYLNAVLELAQKHELPLVATNDVRFLTKDDFEAHEARVCIHDGYMVDDPKRPKVYSAEQYLKTPKEMLALFPEFPEALKNTVEIAKRCNVELELGKNYLPNFPVPKETSIADYLKKMAHCGLTERLSILFSKQTHATLSKDDYIARLNRELKVINDMGFPGYFLIVADFIQWAKEHHIPVGPGRGSGAGSLVAYALKITDLDPLQYDLLFERFLNPERVSMPDFDVDFCMEGRDRVIEYVAEKYGRQSVSQIITYGSLAAKAVVRDVGRVLGQPYGFVDRIAKLIPFEIGMTLNKALEQEEELNRLYQEDDEVKNLINLALKLEGITRNAGKHAGGVVISPSKLTDFSPIYCEEGSTQLVSQFDKDDVEAVGLVKFDFLGLRTLTIIKWAIENVRKHRQENIDITLIPTDDKASFDLLKNCQTTAVFQLESRGMKDLIKRLQPDCFEDIIALVALFRPGPLQSGMVDDFIDRKHGRAAVEYPHPKLEPILKPTYGVILYQEQVMQIAQELAGYSLGAADILRRAMGKKKAEEMAKQREIFIKGAVEREVEESTAAYIFDLMEKFAGYGFNKSHSAAYALVAYQTAWLKAHHPAAFMAAVLSSDMDNTDKVVVFIDECRQMNINVIPPSINHSEYKFTVLDGRTIVYGLGAIKGLGESVIEQIVINRQAKGDFADLGEFCKRVGTKKLNKKSLEALVRSGAMDCFKQTRATLYHSLEPAVKAASQFSNNDAIGQFDLFSQSTPHSIYRTQKEWSSKEKLKLEKETLGLFLSGHPLDDYQEELSHYIKNKIVNLNPGQTKKTTICGLLISTRKIITKREKKIYILSLDDNSARIDISLFEEAYEKYAPLIEKDNILVIEGEVMKDDYTGGVRMMAKKVYSLEDAREAYAKTLHLTINHDELNKVETLKALFLQQKGMTPITITYINPKAQAKILCGEAFKVVPSDALLADLKDLLGSKKVSLQFLSFKS
jgi:DNA polymerase-3 subunit alpha